MRSVVTQPIDYVKTQQQRSKDSRSILRILIDSFKDNPKKFIDKFRIENAALNHLPTTSEVADLCYYLGSENSSAITGQCINIDCGVFPQ